MFTRLPLVAAAIAAAALSLPAPAAAAQPGRSVSAKVSSADLNLATAAGLARIEARVRRAAERLCGDPGVRPLHQVAAARLCVEEAVAGARPQLRDAVLLASQGGSAGSR